MINLASRQLSEESVSKEADKAFDFGKQQILKFIQERLYNNSDCRTSLYSTITKNKLKLYHSKNTIKTTKTKLYVSTLKERTKLYASLYVGCQSRQGNLQEFFSHENHEYPPSISEYGSIRKPLAKSDFVTIIGQEKNKDDEQLKSKDKYDSPNVDACVIDGAALVQMNQPRYSKTYGEYCKNELGSKIKSIAADVKRIDVVFDIYKKSSRKRETRESRGKGDSVRILVKANTPVYNKFSQVLAVDSNKTELFSLIADQLVDTCKNIKTTVMSTKLENVISNHRIETQYLMPCFKEEADDRMFTHVKELSRLGYRKITIVTVDTDVVVIGLYAFWDIYPLIEELWIEFGKGTDKKWIPIHIYAKTLGEEVCRALLFWYALTGCDTVSQFAGCGKKIAWKTWLAFPEANETFTRYE